MIMIMSDRPVCVQNGHMHQRLRVYCGDAMHWQRGDENKQIYPLSPKSYSIYRDSNFC